ncbi:hypothetical protein LDENG_00105950 [Lucifuga dentata]|nr:hypothetical protein LDENG_00105950 [Lucifuga dentata]
MGWCEGPTMLSLLLAGFLLTGLALEYEGVPGQWTRETKLLVDNEEKAAEVKSKRSEMVVASDLYIGGISPDVRLSALTSSTVKYEPPFRGFIANLKLGEALPLLLDGQGVHSDLEYICETNSPCSNAGLCSISQGDVLCDCINTGYRGTYCHEAVQKEVQGLAHLMLNRQGNNSGKDSNVPFLMHKGRR